MPIEIERKFLLSGFPDSVIENIQADGLMNYSGGILQGYINDGLRIRKNHYLFSCSVTQKKGSGIAREENEALISSIAFDLLWELTEGRRIEKHRFNVADTPKGGTVWEIDVYLDKLEGLVVAEIEIGSVDDEVIIPDWLKPLIIKEVTDDDSFSNSSLSKLDKSPV